MDILKEHNFSKLFKHVIIDLYKLCFQNYCASLDYLLYTLNEKKETQNQHKHTMRYTEH